MREIGYGKRNSTWGDYTRFYLWWTCPQAAKKIISSPVFKTYPEYIQESFEELVKLEEQLVSHPEKYHPDYPPKIGLPRGMEFLPNSRLKGEPRKTAEFVTRRNLVAIAVEARDRDKLEIPPGFLTNLRYRPLTKIPRK